MNRARRFQLVFSIAAALGCFLLTVRGYPLLLGRERPPTPLSALPVGELLFNFSSNGKCFGFVRASFTGGDKFEINGEGAVAGSLGDNSTLIDLTLNSGFNSLGQLGGMVLMARSENNSFTFGLSEINPIQVTLIHRANEIRWERKLQIPGPIELIQNADETYRVQYRGDLPVVFGSLSGSGHSPFLQSLALSAEQVSDSSELCSRDALEPVSLDQIALVISRLEGLLGGLRRP